MPFLLSIWGRTKPTPIDRTGTRRSGCGGVALLDTGKGEEVGVKVTAVETTPQPLVLILEDVPPTGRPMEIGQGMNPAYKLELDEAVHLEPAQEPGSHNAKQHKIGSLTLKLDPSPNRLTPEIELPLGVPILHQLSILHISMPPSNDDVKKIINVAKNN